MDDLNEIISENLKRVRKVRQLSLDGLSELSGVSKSMLGQIERRESNPTISTIWKIANGLHLPFTSLIEPQREKAQLVDMEDINPVTDDNGKYRVFSLFPFDEKQRCDMNVVTIEPGGRLESESHGENSCEYIFVYAGCLNITAHGQTYTVGKNQALRFSSDDEHSYEGAADAETRLFMIIYYD